jgi:hypothetical protein
MKRILLYILVVFTFNSITAQTATEILDKYIDHKKVEKQFQVDINYALYKGLKDAKAYESYNGLLAKSNGVLYQKLGSMELIQGKDFIVKLNSEEKAMLVGYSSKPIYNNISELDNEQLLKVFDEKILEDNGDLWKLTLTTKSAELSQFSKIELYLKKSDLQPVKQVFIYSTISDFSAYDKEKTKENLDNPRLEIVYKNYKMNISVNEKVFNSSRYFIHGNNQIKVAAEFKDFEILHAN